MPCARARVGMHVTWTQGWGGVLVCVHLREQRVCVDAVRGCACHLAVVRHGVRVHELRSGREHSLHCVWMTRACGQAQQE